LDHSDDPKPVIAARKPKRVNLEAGKKYMWCSCGKSKNQPFCDGSHVGTSFKPLAIHSDEDREASLCVCKMSGKKPYCDGSHARLDADGNLPEAQSDSPPSAVATAEEPAVERIHELAKSGLEAMGHHGEMVAMGVPGPTLPKWSDIQILAAQFSRKPLLDEAEVSTELVIGPRAKKPLVLEIPVFVSDMSFGALSEEAKTSLARGAQLAGTGICSGEGGMLPEEQAENSRYFYELASAMFGYDEALLSRVQAFHFKGGQGAKTGTGGHLPGNKVIGKIAEVRRLAPGTPAISPSTFADLSTPRDFRIFSDRVREISGGVPIGMKLSANHIEQDLAFAADAGADYIILDGRGGGTGAAPRIFRDNISVPTIPAIARARHFLDKHGHSDVTLIATGGLRLPEDFVKAMCLGADGIAVSNSAMQAIGCIGARICNTNMCPAGIATQDPELRSRVNVQKSAEQLARFFRSSVGLMQVLARACGHQALNSFGRDDITTWSRGMSELSGVEFAGLDTRR
jgi:glutamate synthase domain-containing protein 2/CDGSH-type Zn-finger protein